MITAHSARPSAARLLLHNFIPFFHDLMNRSCVRRLNQLVRCLAPELATVWQAQIRDLDFAKHSPAFVNKGRQVWCCCA